MFGNPVSTLNDYLFPARAQVARMLGLNRDMPPQQRVNQGFSAFPDAGATPPMDFNQSFGAAPFNTPQDRASFLSKYMQGTQAPPQAPGAPMDLSPPNPGPSAPMTQTSGPLTPSGPYGSGNPFSGFMNGMSDMGAQPGAGLIPKFANLIGRGMAGQ